MPTPDRFSVCNCNCSNNTEVIEIDKTSNKSFKNLNNLSKSIYEFLQNNNSIHSPNSELIQLQQYELIGNALASYMDNYCANPYSKHKAAGPSSTYENGYLTETSINSNPSILLRNSILPRTSTNTTLPPNTQTVPSTTPIDDGCDLPEEKRWYVFLGSSLAIFLGGLFIILVSRAINFMCCMAMGEKNGEGDDKSNSGRDNSGQNNQNNQNQNNSNNSNNTSTNQSNLNNDPDASIKRSNSELDLRRKQIEEENTGKVSFMTTVKDWAGIMISAQTVPGRVLVVLVFMMSIAALIIYFIDSSNKTGQTEACRYFRQDTSMQIDLGLNIFFLMYFCLRWSMIFAKEIVTIISRHFQLP